MRIRQRVNPGKGGGRYWLGFRGRVSGKKKTYKQRRPTKRPREVAERLSRPSYYGHRPPRRV